MSILVPTPAYTPTPQPPSEPFALPPAEEPKALPSDEVLELRGMVAMLRDEVRILTERQRDLFTFSDFTRSQFGDRLSALEDQINKPVGHPPEITGSPAQMRAEIKSMVDQAAYETDSDHRSLWGQLYQAFQRTYGVCPEPKQGESKIDAFMRHNLIGPLHRVARVVFGY